MPENEFRKILLLNAAKYPDMQMRDYIKLTYQNEFGCEHMVSDKAGSLGDMKKEYIESAALGNRGEAVQTIGNGYARINIGSYLPRGFLPYLNEMFVVSAARGGGNERSFLGKAEILLELIGEKKLPLDKSAAESYLKEYLSGGIRAVSHSECYRQSYAPHYRVVLKEYADFLPIFIEISQEMSKKERIMVAIDGQCASGKSFLARSLAQIFDANVFHMDDFFLPPHMRDEKRLSKPGENVHHERFLENVLEPLAARRDVNLVRYDCQKDEFLKEQKIEAKKVNIVEGSYSMHENLKGFYDIKVFLCHDKDKQRERISAREDEDSAEMFFEKWILLEEMYFEATGVKNECDFVFDTGDMFYGN